MTKNFSKSEFDSKDGEIMPHCVYENIKELGKNIQVVRHFIGKPMKINSGYRSIRHNRIIGSKDTSQHTYGKACDISIEDISPIELYEIIEALIEEGAIREGGLGLYNTFVHYDIRGTKARWDNT